jgi:hypothetical protein
MANRNRIAISALLSWNDERRRVKPFDQAPSRAACGGRRRVGRDDQQLGATGRGA